MSNYREDYYHELLPMPIGGRMESKPRLQWLKAMCPICGKEYEYLPTYKPKTCGKFTCLQEANKRNII